MIISARKLFLILIAANLLLIILHLVSQFFIINTDLSPLMYQIASRFNMDSEISIPTWFAQSLLFVASLLFGYTALVAKQAKAGFVKTWWFLAGLFLFAGIDEGSSLHELATEPFQDMFGITEGAFFFAWVIPGIIILMVICASLLRFFMHLPYRAKITFASAALALFGAICVEMISGIYWEASGFYENLTYPFLNVLEEGLENTAFIITIYGLLRFIATHSSDKLPTVRIAN